MHFIKCRSNDLHAGLGNIQIRSLRQKKNPLKSMQIFLKYVMYKHSVSIDSTDIATRIISAGFF